MLRVTLDPSSWVTWTEARSPPLPDAHRPLPEAGAISPSGSDWLAVCCTALTQCWYVRASPCGSSAMRPADARYPSANSMSVLVPGRIWMRAPSPARLMPQPAPRPKPAAFQTTVPLAGVATPFCPAEGPASQTLQPAAAASRPTVATVFTTFQVRSPRRRLTGSGAAGGGVLAAGGGLGGGGGFGAASGGRAVRRPGVRDSS